MGSEKTAFRHSPTLAAKNLIELVRMYKESDYLGAGLPDNPISLQPTPDTCLVPTVAQAAQRRLEPNETFDLPLLSPLRLPNSQSP